MTKAKDSYSPLKIFHHRDRIDALRRGDRPQLLHAQLILTNRCNQCCSFCAYRSNGYPSCSDFKDQNEISTDKALEIVSDCRRLGVGAIELTGGGEPTIHPGFVEVCQHIRTLGMEYAVVSNGSRWTDETFLALQWASWVRISIDSGRPSTYTAIRRSAPEVFHKVHSNIRRLVAIDGPVIGIGFVVTKDNWLEITEAANQALQDGVDNFRISAAFTPEGAEYFRPFYFSARELCAQAKTLETDEFKVFNLFGDRIEDLKQRSPTDPFCPIQQLVTYIGADLDVYRCCVLAYSRAGRIGSLDGKSLYELWNSPELAFKLIDFNAMNCPMCMFNSKNATIRYAINPDPQHANFL